MHRTWSRYATSSSLLSFLALFSACVDPPQVASSGADMQPDVTLDMAADTPQDMIEPRPDQGTPELDMDTLPDPDQSTQQEMGPPDMSVDMAVDMVTDQDASMALCVEGK